MNQEFWTAKSEDDTPSEEDIMRLIMAKWGTVDIAKVAVLLIDEAADSVLENGNEPEIVAYAIGYVSEEIKRRLGVEFDKEDLETLDEATKEFDSEWFKTVPEHQRDRDSS